MFLVVEVVCLWMEGGLCHGSQEGALGELVEEEHWGSWIYVFGVVCLWIESALRRGSKEGVLVLGEPVEGAFFFFQKEELNYNIN